MANMRNWMLGAALAAGGLGLAAAPAQAAEFGVYARGPVAYVPPCPGAGYVWAAGFYRGGYWVPGRWNYIGVRGPAHFDRFERERFYDRDRFAHERFEHDRFRR
jgi:hypothetical protein